MSCASIQLLKEKGTELPIGLPSGFQRMRLPFCGTESMGHKRHKAVKFGKSLYCIFGRRNSSFNQREIARCSGRLIARNGTKR